MVDLRDIVHRVGAGEVRAGGREAFIPAPGHSRRDRGIHLTVTDGGRVLWNAFNEAAISHPAMLEYLGIEGHQAGKLDRREIEAQKQRRDAERRRLDAENTAFCREIWEGTEPVEGTVAEAYLYGRGLILEGCNVIRFHPAAPRCKPRTDPPPPAPHAAMMAVVQDVTGAPRGLHATYLKHDGTKAFGDRSRLMFGQLAGAAVRLEPIGTDGVLGIAEGIETAASFSVIQGVPTWAALSTSGLQGFVLPAAVRKLVIAADSDDATGEGLRIAEGLAERARHRCDVEVRPAPAGKDWNDVLRGRG